MWQAVSKNGHTIGEGERVKVLERQGMTLFVVPAENMLIRTQQRRKINAILQLVFSNNIGRYSFLLSVPR
jgi:hypothetical protein